MGIDVSARIVVGVPLADLVQEAGVVPEVVTKYNEDTGDPYEATKSRKRYILIDGRDITVNALNGESLLDALGLEDASVLDGEAISGELGCYNSIIGIKVVETGSNRVGDSESATTVMDIRGVEEEASDLLAQHFGLLDTEMQVFVQTVFS